MPSQLKLEVRFSVLSAMGKYIILAHADKWIVITLSWRGEKPSSKVTQDVLNVEGEMNHTKNIDYRIEQMPEFVVDQLASGILSTFLPVSFVCDQQQYTGVYNTNDYRPLSSVKEISIGALFRVVQEMMKILAENEKHYVFGETYILNRETVYVDAQFTKVKLIFKPLERLCTTKEQLMDFLETCKPIVSEDGLLYLKDACDFLAQEEVGYNGMMHHIAQLQQEIYACDIF